MSNPSCSADSLGFCPVSTTVSVMGGKWKPTILYYIKDKPRRNSELLRLIPSVTQKVLTRHLRELEQDGIIHREVFPVIPPHVEYTITEYGRTLGPILEAMVEWGMHHASQQSKDEAIEASELPQVQL